MEDSVELLKHESRVSPISPVSYINDDDDTTMVAR